MFKLKIRSLNSDYGTTTEQLVTDFLRAIGFLGNDGGRNKVTKRSQHDVSGRFKIGSCGVLIMDSSAIDAFVVELIFANTY